VDTGSTDRTREVAARRGARVFDFPWCEVYNDGEGTAGDGRIEGSIGLQEVVVGAEVEVSTLGTDDSLCHRPCQVERSADGQYAVADLQRGAMPWPLERDGGRSKDTGVVGGRRCRFAHGCRKPATTVSELLPPVRNSGGHCPSRNSGGDCSSGRVASGRVRLGGCGYGRGRRCRFAHGCRQRPPRLA